MSEQKREFDFNTCSFSVPCIVIALFLMVFLLIGKGLWDNRIAASLEPPALVEDVNE